MLQHPNHLEITDGQNYYYPNWRIDSGYDSGIDWNQNAILDISEITTTTYVCDGQNGVDGQDGADGAQGPQGPAGNDGADGQDGADGAPGADGMDGQDGSDGFDSIANTYSILPGIDCEDGGIMLENWNRLGWKWNVGL